jgi:hypothetical protein
MWPHGCVRDVRDVPCRRRGKRSSQTSTGAARLARLLRSQPAPSEANGRPSVASLLSTARQPRLIEFPSTSALRPCGVRAPQENVAPESPYIPYSRQMGRPQGRLGVLDSFESLVFSLGVARNSQLTFLLWLHNNAEICTRRSRPVHEKFQLLMYFLHKALQRLATWHYHSERPHEHLRPEVPWRWLPATLYEYTRWRR